MLMPYEHGDASFDELVMELSVINDIIARNAACHLSCLAATSILISLVISNTPTC